MDISRFDESSILDLIPDGILALDRDLVVRRINPAACRLLGVREPAEVLGVPVSGILGESAFLRLRDGQETELSDIVVLHGGDTLLACTFCCDESRALFVCVIRDIPEQQGEEHLRRELRGAELADAICEKHLRLVQEIAGLLGETAVETLAAAEELKKTLLPGRVDK